MVAIWYMNESEKYKHIHVIYIKACITLHELEIGFITVKTVMLFFCILRIYCVCLGIRGQILHFQKTWIQNKKIFSNLAPDTSSLLQLVILLLVSTRWQKTIKSSPKEATHINCHWRNRIASVLLLKMPKSIFRRLKAILDNSICRFCPQKINPSFYRVRMI